MSKTASASGTIGFDVVDWVTVNSVDFYACRGTTITVTSTYVGSATSVYRCFFCDFSTGPDFGSRIANTMDSLAKTINAYTIEQSAAFGVYAYRDVERGGAWIYSRENTGDGYITLIRATPDLGDFSFACTVRPGAFRPNTGTAGAVTTTSTRARNRLHWSKVDEPEAVPTLNYTDVGGPGDVLALTPIENAMLVFKEDGIYAVRGSAPSSWIVDDVDLSMRLLAPQATCVLEGVCYAWTDRGVVAVTEAGARVISGPVSDQLREYQRLLPADNANTKRGFWMVAHPRYSMVILGTGTSASATSATYWYVFSTITGRWSRWLMISRCAAYDPAEDRMIHSSSADLWHALYERTDEDDPASRRDATVSGLAGTVATTVVTIAIAAFGGYEPGVGDVIVDSLSAARVVTVVDTSGANFLITVASSGLAGVSFTLHKGWLSELVWNAQQMPGQCMRWSEAHAHFQQSDQDPITNSSGVPIDIGGYSENTTTPYAGSYVSTYIGDTALLTSQPEVVRVGLPRDIVRATHLYPRISIAGSGNYWVLSALDLHAQPAMHRVSK
jgi:hypothetical protein